MLSEINNIIIEETEERLKVIIPVRINWLLLILFTAVLVVWLGMLLVVLLYLIRGMSSSFVLTAILVIWIVIWLWFGRFLSTRWQYQAANREILFIDDDLLIIRRPVSIFGLTTSYDRQHIGPFYYSENHDCPAFDYAFLHVYFGRSLEKEPAKELLEALNNRLFPGLEDDEFGR